MNPFSSSIPPLRLGSNNNAQTPERAASPAVNENTPHLLNSPTLPQSDSPKINATHAKTFQAVKVALIDPKLSEEASPLKDQVMAKINQFYSTHTLNNNAFFTNNDIQEKLVEYAQGHGLNELMEKISQAPNFFLKSPGYFITFIESKDSPIEDPPYTPLDKFQDALLYIKDTQKSLLDIEFETIKTLLDLIQEHKLKNLKNPDKTERAFRVYSRELSKKLAEDPFKFRYHDLERNFMILSLQDVKSTFNQIAKKIDDSLLDPEINDQNFYFYEDFFSLDKNNMLLLINAACQNPQAFKQDPLKVIEDLKDAQDIAKAVSNIAHNPPKTLENLYDSPELKDYKENLLDLLAAAKPDLSELAASLNLKGTLNKQLLRTYIKIGRQISLLPSDGSDVVHHTSKDLGLLGHTSFSIIRKNNDYTIYLGGHHRASGAAKKIISALTPSHSTFHIRGSSKTRRSIDKTKIEITFLEELAKKKCPFLLSPYAVSFTISNKYGEDKLIFYGNSFKGDGKLARQEDELTSARIYGNIAEGLSVLHSLKYVHGDVKPANFLVSDEKKGVLIDFGCTVPEEKETSSGTNLFWSPELTYYGKIIARPSLDIWGLGASILENTMYAVHILDLNTLRRSSSQEVIDQFLNREKDFIKKSTLSESVKSSKLAKIDLITPLFSYDAFQRPTAAQVAELLYNFKLPE